MPPKRNELIHTRWTLIQRLNSFYLYVIRGTSAEKVAAATGVKPNDVYLVKHRLTPLFEKAVRAVESN